HRGDAVLGDERRLLERRDLIRTLDHARLPEHLIRRHQSRAGQPLLDTLPRGREEIALVEPDATPEDAEIAEHAGERVGGAGGRRACPLANLAADLARIIGVFEEELAVACEMVDLDSV